MDGGRLDVRERRDWLRLILTEHVGPATFARLLESYGSAEDAIAALPKLSRRGGLKRALKVCPADKAEAVLERCDEIGARFVASREADYPSLLAHIHDAPPLLCIMGSTKLAQHSCVAIVGARNASALGLKFARTLARDLSEAGLTVVSGLARGIDTAAHEASVESATVAVLAGGLDIVYPPENRELQERIAQDGLLVSEMVPGTRPTAQHFPRRNRLISGISRGVVVIEAASRSGSLITARMALEQNRDVFAVPGNPLDPRAEGTNRLIRDGAVLVRDAGDVIEHLGDLSDVPASYPPMRESGAEARTNAGADESARNLVLELLSAAPVEIDEIVRESGLQTGIVMSALLELELAGRVDRLPGQRVTLKVP